MVSAIRKIATKPVWWWERKRSYRIRSQFDRLPPMTVHPAPRRFVVLTTLEAVNDSLWAAWSWYRYLREEGFELHLATDGELPDAIASAAQRLFPGISICNVGIALQLLGGDRPGLAAFFRHHPVAKQVGLVLALSSQGPVLYSDHDVIAFNRPHELLECVKRDIPCYFPDEGRGCHDPALVARLNALGLEYEPVLNAGFLYIPSRALSVDLAERILANWEPLPLSYFSPQTVMSALMRNANARPLPGDRYVISSRRQFYWEKDVDYSAIAARHFTGTVRHVMYRYGLPALLRQSKLWREEPENA